MDPRLSIRRTFGCTFRLLFPVQWEQDDAIAAALYRSSGLQCLIDGEEEDSTQWKMHGDEEGSTDDFSYKLTSPRLQAQQGLDQLMRMLAAAKEARAEPNGGVN
eukprot:3366091-Prymnesium_polylepis.1